MTAAVASQARRRRSTNKTAAPPKGQSAHVPSGTAPTASIGNVAPALSLQDLRLVHGRPAVSDVALAARAGLSIDAVREAICEDPFEMALYGALHRADARATAPGDYWLNLEAQAQCIASRLDVRGGWDELSALFGQWIHGAAIAPLYDPRRWFGAGWVEGGRVTPWRPVGLVRSLLNASEAGR